MSNHGICGFVRGLWGQREEEFDDEDSPDYAPTLTLPKALRDVIYTTSDAFYEPGPCLYYAYGQANADFLESLGVSVELLSEEGIKDFSEGKAERNVTQDDGGRINYGVSFWRHKLECIRLAFKTFDQVIWLDWDCHFLGQKLPRRFWKKMNERAPIQGALQRYVRPQCPWRENRAEQGPVPHGAFVYCRDRAIMDRVWEVHSTMYPHHTDEVAYAYVIDELMGGWKGTEAYKEAGYEPYCYHSRRNFFEPEVRLFEE